MSTQKKYRFLFAGGGTGGHLFPAIAVAEKIKMLMPDAEILFVGSKNKIEGSLVPKLGYKFKSIWIKGFARRFDIENILFPVKLFVSLVQSLVINLKFNPSVAIGSGGYAAGPVIYGSHLTGSKILLLEQNSFPGVTTRLLEKYADEIHISFEDSQKYFKYKEKLKLSGNPVRSSLKIIKREDALKKFGLSIGKKTLLVIGGSLGAASINNAIADSIELMKKENIQIIWQAGKIYYEMYKKYESVTVKVKAFIDDMNIAFSACDLLLARAGATTIAEISVLGIPCILVPSPNVAENHQYYNAKSLSDESAAVLIEDKELKNKLVQTVKNLIIDESRLSGLRKNSLRFGKPEAAMVIAKSALKYAELK